LAAADIGAERDRTGDGAADGLPFLRFSNDARVMFVDWRRQLEDAIRAADGGALNGALSKFRHHVPALALCVHLADGQVGPIGVPAMTRALKLASYFESHARRLHGSSRRAGVKAARAILAKVKTGALRGTFTARDIYIKDWSSLNDPETVRAGLEMLAGCEWVFESKLDTGGRPFIVYTLNPAAVIP